MQPYSDVAHLLTPHDKVMPHHRQTYFPPATTDLPLSGTISQLRNYIHNYGQAIHASIQAATARSISHTRPIWSFHGFTRRTPSLPDADAPTTDAPTNPPTAPATPMDQRPPPTPDHAPRPRTVIRHIQQTITSIFRRQPLYPSSSPQPPPPPIPRIPDPPSRHDLGPHHHRDPASKPATHPSTPPIQSTPGGDAVRFPARSKMPGITTHLPSAPITLVLQGGEIET